MVERTLPCECQARKATAESPLGWWGRQHQNLLFLCHYLTVFSSSFLASSVLALCTASSVRCFRIMISCDCSSMRDLSSAVSVLSSSFSPFSFARFSCIVLISCKDQFGSGQWGSTITCAQFSMLKVPANKGACQCRWRASKRTGRKSHKQQQWQLDLCFQPKNTHISCSDSLRSKKKGGRRMGICADFVDTSTMEEQANRRGQYPKIGIQKMEIQFFLSKTCVVDKFWHFCSHL